jgi:site-specific DNA recombinase
MGKSKVIVIDRNRKLKRKIKVCAYIRVSTDSKDQLNSYSLQYQHYQDLIQSNTNWIYVDIYADEGITGTSAAGRPELQRLLVDCRNRRIDRILIKSLSRFARNTKESLEMIRELRSLGISIFFEKENIDTAKATDEFLITLYSQIAQEESISLSQNMKRSYKTRMEQGKFLTCSAPFGYDLEKSELIINESESAVVRGIFSSYLSGKSTREIATELTHKKIPNKKGNTEWDFPTVRYILKNEKYIGDAVLQKTYTTSVKSQSFVNKGQHQKYYLKNSHTAIIDRETFDSARRIIERNAPKVSGERHFNPLNRKVYCGHCGSIYKLRRCRDINYRVCINHDTDKNLCPSKRITESEINMAFVRMFNKVQINKEHIITPMIKEFKSLKEKSAYDNDATASLNKELADIMEQLSVLSDLRQQEHIDQSFYVTQSNEHKTRIDEIKKEKELLMNTIYDETISKSVELLKMLRTMPESIESSSKDIILKLIDRITVVSEIEIQFRLVNGLAVTEHLKRVVR